MTKEELRDYKAIKTEMAELDRLLTRLARYDTPELQRLYKGKRAALARRLSLFEQAIDELRPTERRLMRMRYIERLSWEAIARRLCYSRPQTLRIHQSALQALRDK